MPDLRRGSARTHALAGGVGIALLGHEQITVAVDGDVGT
jgi:hypothetical protein